MSIRTKLALWYSILLIVILALLAIVRHVGYKRMLDDQKDYSLKVVADILDNSIPRKTPTKKVIQGAVKEMVTDYSDIEMKGMIIEAYDRSGSLIFSSSLSEEERLPLTEEMWKRISSKKVHIVTMSLHENIAPVRILTKPVFHKNNLLYIIQVGSSIRDVETALDNSLLLNLFFIPTATLLVAIGGWLLTMQALKPLGAVIKTAHRISSGNLSHRIESSQTSEEIQELVQSFNQMIARLETSFQQIRDFTDNVSHELRIPLSILRGQTELSLRRLRSEEAYRKVLDSNLEEIRRMENIVDRLLFLSRADRGEIKLNLTPIDLNSLIKNVYAQFSASAQEKNLRIRLEEKGPDVIIGDEVLLREVLVNIVNNAIKYTPEGGEVALWIERGETQSRIVVADTGCGIPENEIPWIFDRFYQVDKSRSSQGSGLGLSICKWIVEAHQGSILVESAAGQGSRFIVSLPCYLKPLN